MQVFRLVLILAFLRGQEIYLGKTRDIINDLRSMEGLDEGKKRKGLQSELVGLLKK